MPGFMKRIKRFLSTLDRWLLAILALALFLRLWGITHGLPHIYNVDEPVLVRSIMGLRFDINPHHFDWPHFHYYFCYFFFVALVKFRTLLQMLDLRPLLESWLPILWQDPQVFYLEVRLISALMGVATIIPLYLLGAKLFGRKVGLLAAAFFAVAPFAVENAHYAVLDTPLTFWVTWAVYFSVLSFLNSRWRDYLVAGLFVGLAASTKYNGVFAGLAVLAAALCSPGRSWRAVRGKLAKLVGAGVVCLLAFFAGTPFAILDWQKALTPVTDPHAHHGILWQFSRSGKHLDAGAPGRVLAVIGGDLVDLVGLLPLVLVGVSAIFVFWGKSAVRRKYLFLLFFPLCYFLFFASGEFSMIHYFLPIVPSLLVLAAVGLRMIWELGQLGKLRKLGLALLVLVPSLVGSARASYILSQPDTRQVASDWVAENIPQGSVLAKDGEYQPVLGGFEPLPIKDWSPPWFEQEQVDYFIISGYGLTEERLYSRRSEVEDVFRRASLVKLVSPAAQPGPTIMIFALDK